MTHSLLGVGISRGCHLNPAQAGALDCLAHQSRGLGLLDELAEVGETSSVALRYQRRVEDDPEAVPWNSGLGVIAMLATIWCRGS